MRSQPRWRSCRHSLADLSRLPVRFDPLEQPARPTHRRPQILDASREYAVRGHDGDHPTRSRRSSHLRDDRVVALATRVNDLDGTGQTLRHPAARPPFQHEDDLWRETGRGDEALVQPTGRAGSVLPPAVGSGSDDVRAVDHQHLGAGRGGRGCRVRGRKLHPPS